MKLADEAVEKIAEVAVHLGEAAIIAGVGPFLLKLCHGMLALLASLLEQVLLPMESFLFTNLKVGANNYGKRAFGNALCFSHRNSGFHSSHATIEQRSESFKKVTAFKSIS
jgi:hypothetical protein